MINTVYELWWSHGPFKVLLDRPKGTTIWTYRVQNGEGGSSGSTHRGSKRAALCKATHGMPVGTKYQLITNGRNEGERIHA